MSQSLLVTLLLAEDGDCLLLSLGSAAHLLLDSGRLATYSEHLRPLLLTQATHSQPLDCCIITHMGKQVASDH